MKLSDDLYQTSGLQYGTNSNTFAIRAGSQVIVIDTGFSPRQFDIAMNTLKAWGMEGLPVSNVFITHAHFDHSGNAHLFRATGASIICGEADARAIEAGDDLTLQDLFGAEFQTCVVDHRARDGEVFTFGDVRITVVGTPGHTPGSIAIHAEVGERAILFVSDTFVLKSATPQDDLVLELGWSGSPGFDGGQYIDSIARLGDLRADIVAAGHNVVYFGDSRPVFSRLHDMAVQAFGGR